MVHWFVCSYCTSYSYVHIVIFPLSFGIRISKVARSAGWIKTEYVNETSSTFFTVGTGSSNAKSAYLTWDYLNRLTQATATTTATSTYAYAPWGTRVKSTQHTSK